MRDEGEDTRGEERIRKLDVADYKNKKGKKRTKDLVHLMLCGLVFETVKKKRPNMDNKEYLWMNLVGNGWMVIHFQSMIQNPFSDLTL